MTQNNTLDIGPGCIILVNEITYCITSFETPDSVKARNIATGVDEVIGFGEITESYGSYKNGAKIDLQAIEPEDWDRAIEIYRTLEPLLNNPDRTALDVKSIGDSLLLSTATVYRYLEKIETYGTVTCLLRKIRSDKFDKRLDPQVEAIVKEVIATVYLTDKKPSPTTAHTEIKRRCRELKLQLPSKSTLLRRIDELVPEERERKRNGRSAALDFRAKRGTVPNAEHLHSLWQIDHTMVDIMLVDEKDRIPIGRPWITLAMEVFSRTVVGWYISFDTPGALGTGICISRAILAKDDLLIRLGVSLPWPCQGKPGIIMMDNAKEFRGNMLKSACSEHGFELKFRPVKRPHYGGHIERILGTLLTRIHALDGTTFSNTQERGEYDSEGNATMTLDDFERWLANLILGPYHHEIHSALGCSPLQRYKEGIFGNDLVPGIGILPIATDPEKLRYDFLPFEKRTIQTYGTVLDHIQYHDPVLDKWIGSVDPGKRKEKRKFIFRRDPRDISYLIFWDPHVQQYYRIPYRDARRPAISLWELKAVQRYLRNKGKEELDEDMIFSALNEMRAIEESSKDLTRKARLDQERRRRHRRSAEVPTTQVQQTSGEVLLKETPPVESSPGLIDFDNLTPFDEVEPM